jgi:hypothetical protein
MLDREETEKQLETFKRYVVAKSKMNLKTSKKNTSGKLSNSIKGVTKVNPNSISLYFEMLDYGVWQDKGVNGYRSVYTTPYSFKKNVPSRQMLKNLDRWIVKKGIAPRDKNGKFINRLGFKFAIAKNIFKNGIKPSLFFTKPFEKAYKNLPNELISAYGLDITKNFIDAIETKK